MSWYVGICGSVLLLGCPAHEQRGRLAFRERDSSRAEIATFTRLWAAPATLHVFAAVLADGALAAA